MRFDLATSGIIGKILKSRAHGRPLKMFEMFLNILNYYFKKLSGTGKNYAYCKCEKDCFCKLTIRQLICTIRQPIVVRHIFFRTGQFATEIALPL